MPELIRVGDLEVPQDLAYEDRAYRLRFVAAAMGLLLLLAALLGLLGGSGPLVDATAASDNGDSVSFDRFTRLEAPTELTVSLASGSGETPVAISREYLEWMQIRGYSVEPESVTARKDRIVFTFELEAPAEVQFDLQPRRFGRIEATVWGPGDRPLSFEQWVYP